MTPRKSLKDAFVAMVSTEALAAMMDKWGTTSLVSRDFEPTLAMPGDKVSSWLTSTGETIEITLEEIEESFTIPNFSRAFENPELVARYVLVPVEALLEKMTEKTLSAVEKTGEQIVDICDICTVIRRRVKPLPGTGKIAQYAETGSIGFQVVLNDIDENNNANLSLFIIFGVGYFPGGER